MRTWVYIICALATACAVDRSNFKKCSDSSFCKRNRELSANATIFRAHLNTVQDAAGHVQLDVQNTVEDVLFVLDMFFYQDSTFRFKLNEKQPKYPRYEVEGVLEDKPLASIKVSKSSSDVSVEFGESNKVILQNEPLRLDVYRGNKLYASFNRRGLLNFEHYRDKREGDSDDMWEENFKSHKDTKPRGPASVGFDVSFPGVEHVYGIPEHAHDFSLPSTKDSEPFRLYNLDVFEYELDETMALYGSIPYMVGHSADHTVGVLFLNSAEMWIDISSSRTSKSGIMGAINSLFSEKSQPQTDSHWFAESGIIDVFVFLGPSPSDVAQQYAATTGKPLLPPLFSIAFHQCRWNYNDEADVAFVDSQYDAHDMPVDVIWLDIEHTDGKRYFTWDSSKFPDPTSMQDKLAHKGRKMVTIIDPHIKRASGYHVHEKAQELGYYIKNKDQGEYDGWCWPGSSSWLDFTNPQIRDWWSSLFATDTYKGSTHSLYVWNDMNEPSVFNGPEVTMHKDAIHFGDVEHRDVHNIYGMWQHAATAQGIVERSGGVERPFVLSRAFFAGSQKYGAIWTGDNTADWGHLKASIPMILSIGVAGLPFAGADIGGFFGNPDEELQVRWMQAGAYQPFMRAHAHLDTQRREPYLLEDANRAIVRQAIRRRYELLPFWYTLYYESSTTGQPVMRPLWWHYPDNTDVFAEQECYLLGSDILVAPVLAKGQTSVSAYLPSSDLWYDMDTLKRQSSTGRVALSAPLNKVPAFQRGGSIVARKMRVRRASSLMVTDPFTLYVALDKSGAATGKLFIDDYHTFAYEKENQYALVQMDAVKSGSTLTISFKTLEGDYTSSEWIERVVIMGMSTKASSAVVKTNAGSNSVTTYYDSSRQVVEVKKPGFVVTEPATIEVSF